MGSDSKEECFLLHSRVSIFFNIKLRDSTKYFLWNVKSHTVCTDGIEQYYNTEGQKLTTPFRFHLEMPSRCPQVYVTRWKKYSRKRVGFLKAKHTRCWMPWRKPDAFKVKPGPDLSIKSIALINKK